MNNSLFVFSSVGSKLDDSYKNQVFTSWELNNFNSGCVIYNDNFLYNRYFNITLHNKDYKFPNFFYFNSIYAITSKYKYIAILDDDLLFHNINSLNTCLELMKKFNLSLCSLSNNNQGKKSYYPIMASTDTNHLWITNFCEMGCMIFRSSLLKLIIKIYNNKYKKLKDWGFDWFICSLANQYKHNIGIIKNLSFSNPVQSIRDIGKSEWIQYKNEIKYSHPKILRIYDVKN